MSPAPRRTPRLPPEVRRRELLDAALEVVGEDGFAATTVESVASRAGLSRPVVYDLFGDLEGLLLALVDREEGSALRPLLEIVGESPRDEVDPEAFLEEAVTGFLTAVQAEPRTWRLVLMPPQGGSALLRERLVATRRLISDRVRSLLEWGVSRRGGPEGLDLPLFARLIVAAGEDAARLTLLHPDRYPPERIGALARGALAVLPASARASGSAPPAALAAVRPAADAIRTTPGPSGRVPRSERREQLLDVTLDLLADDGFEALTMEAIAGRAGVNRTIVYRSFANLQLLLLALYRREDARTRTMLDSLLPDQPSALTERRVTELLAEALAAFLSSVTASPQTYRVVLQRPETAPRILQKIVNRRRTDLAERLRPLVGTGLEQMPVPDDRFDVDVMARMLLSAGEELGRLVLEYPEEFPPGRIASSTWALLDAVPER